MYVCILYAKILNKCVYLLSSCRHVLMTSVLFAGLIMYCYVFMYLQVLLQEKLLAQEVSFKASCTATLSELQDEIAALDDSLKLSGIDAAREQISGQPHNRDCSCQPSVLNVI